jgi:hypothetical protein
MAAHTWNDKTERHRRILTLRESIDDLLVLQSARRARNPSVYPCLPCE